MSVAVSFALSMHCAVANMARTQQQPSQAQLQRLHNLEPYIRYFSSLTYDGARVSPDYIRALILTESGGDRWAKSNKGARGLTQIIPSTGHHAAKGLLEVGYDFLYVDESALEAFEAGDLFDPAINILMACYLSATYHAKYEGSTELVVSAWNAGPGAVRRYGNKPPPYPETQAMITRLTGYISFLETRSE
jgi:soluble lytic murein transglycosylase-like protein